MKPRNRPAAYIVALPDFRAGCDDLGTRVPSVMDRASSFAAGANSCFSEAVADAIQRFDNLEIGVDYFELLAQPLDVAVDRAIVDINLIVIGGIR